MEMYKEFTFDSAHLLPEVPADHKCARLHGHTFTVTVTVSGPVDARAGWVMDFGELKEIVAPVIDELDHQYLNDLPGLANPTAEHIAHWIWVRVAPSVPGLSSIAVRETCTAGVVYRGD
jgi:6-pyruvoyltetrahydropterin/6-carboxytetrahydropterin synthase